MSPAGVPVVAPALRRVGVATVAAVAVSGATVALTGSAGPAPDTGVPRTDLAAVNGAAALLVPAPALVSAQNLVPVPRTGAAVAGSDTPGLDTAVLDTAGLARAVARAQQQARRLADEARDRADEERRAAADERADEDDEQTDEEREAAERARRIGQLADPEPDRTSTAAPDCDLATGRLGAVKAHVRAAAQILGCAFGEPEVLGIAGRGGPSDHPRGLALDFMVDRATGDALAACALRNREALGISYVIWRQRIDTGSGFRAMADRGGATANHFDHVHVSFEPNPGTGNPVDC